MESSKMLNEPIKLQLKKKQNIESLREPRFSRFGTVREHYFFLSEYSKLRQSILKKRNFANVRIDG